MLSRQMLLILALGTMPSLAQSNLLQIVSPASGTMVYPGQTVIITVRADSSVSNVAIMGWDPLGFSQKTNGQPLEFQLTIPAKITPGAYEVHAVGSASRQLAVSPPISLRVEIPRTRFQMRTEPSVEIFEKPGEIDPLHIFGKFPDGSEADVTHSVQVKCSSENPRVVTVDKDCIVTAVGLGSTHVIISTLASGQYYVYTEVGQLAKMNNLGLAQMLPGSSVTFRWNGSNTATAFRIDVGSTKGGHEYYQSASLPRTTLWQTVDNLPTDGQKIYVSLCSQIGATWGCNEYYYAAFNQAGRLAQ